MIDRRGQQVRSARWHQQPSLARYDHVRDGVYRCCDHRNSADHGFDDRGRQSFIAARKGEDVQGWQDFKDVGALPSQNYIRASQRTSAAVDTGGELAISDPDADDIGSVQVLQGSQEVLGSFLVGQPADDADDLSVNGQAERATSTQACLRVERAHARPCSGRARYCYAYGADSVWRNEAPPHGFSGHARANAQGDVGVSAKPSLYSHVGLAASRRLKLVEREAVVGMHDLRDV